MSAPETQKDSGPVPTTGHEWDGIRELDNPLPRWWLWIFYASVVYAIGYWILMPAWPGLTGYTRGVLGKSDRAAVVEQLSELKTLRGQQNARLTQASLQEIESDPKLQAHALAVGQSVFGDNCATCHGVGGIGSKGYANLRDDVWLWGGTLEDIHRTLQYGIRSGHPQARVSQMPAFGKDQILTAAQVDDQTEFVVALSGRPANAAAVQRAAPVYAANCVACHGPEGRGDPLQGAPNLTDKEWLYGSARQDIKAQIHAGRGGVMPAWSGRLDPETVKALAVYVHANAAGQ
jgi:cytochrome c oxidase cbb3-type subunit 3